MKEKTDYEIFRGYFRGNTEDAKRLLEESYLKTWQYLLRYIHKNKPYLVDEARDILNDASVRALEKIYKFKEDDDFCRWLFGIAKKIVLERSRNHKDIVNLDSDDIESLLYNGVQAKKGITILEEFERSYLAPTEVWNRNPSLYYDKKEEHEIIKKVLLLLTKEEQIVLILRGCRKVQFKDIADKLGCTENAANKKFNRAAKKYIELLYKNSF